MGSQLHKQTREDIHPFGKCNQIFTELYKLFGVNAELLIDHAWGWEPCTIADIKAYRPESNSISSGQVLHEPYTCEKAKLIVREMTDLLVLDLVDKGLVTNQMVLTIGYDREKESSWRMALRSTSTISTLSLVNYSGTTNSNRPWR